VQTIRRLQQDLKIGSADLIDQVRGDQCMPRAAALIGGLPGLIGDVDHVSAFVLVIMIATTKKT
jgi:hypothetical protein